MCVPQLVVHATRQSSVTLQSATGTVSVTVLRNQNAPRFLNEPCYRQVDENTLLGRSIVQLTATDGDANVSLSFFLFWCQCPVEYK